MTWTKLPALALASALLVPSIAILPHLAHAQLPITPGAASTATFGGFAGGGFDPGPTTGRLDSDTWQPFGLGIPTTPFGGTCVGPGPCARGHVMLLSAALGGAGFYVLDPSATFPSPSLAMLVSDGVLSPGGVRLRLVNADSSAVLTHADVKVTWARRLGLVPGTLPPETLTFDADDCGVSGISYPLVPGMDAVSGTTGPVHWEGHDTSLTLDLRPAPLAPGDTACISFHVGSPSLLRDIVAIGLVRVTVPDAVCGDGFLDLPAEECEPDHGGITGPCDCRTDCHYPPADTACDDADGNPCTAGLCERGACAPVDLDGTEYVPACDNDANPCTIEGCTAGECATLTGCPTPSSHCRTCDPATFSCDVPAVGMAGCCTGNADCFVDACLISTCDVATGACTTPLPNPACTSDAGPAEDAATDTDAGTSADGGSATDGGSVSDTGPRFDASGAIDASGPVPGPGIGFGGGGGCRCRAAGTEGGARGASLLVVGLALALARARRKR